MATVAEIWRYPVKSMGGERLPEAMLGRAGLEGDRRFALLDGQPNRQGKKLTARQLSALLGYRAAFRDGVVEVTSAAGQRHQATSPAVLAELEAAAGRPVGIADRPGHNFDDSALLVVNLASVWALEPLIDMPVDHRRFRANLYLTGLPARAELEWVGRELRVGGARLRAAKPCERCVVVTYDPDTLEPAPRLLRLLAQVQGGSMGLYCDVLEAGLVREGDAAAAAPDPLALGL